MRISNVGEEVTMRWAGLMLITTLAACGYSEPTGPLPSKVDTMLIVNVQGVRGELRIATQPDGAGIWFAAGTLTGPRPRFDATTSTCTYKLEMWRGAVATGTPFGLEGAVTCNWIGQAHATADVDFGTHEGVNWQVRQVEARGTP